MMPKFKVGPDGATFISAVSKTAAAYDKIVDAAMGKVAELYVQKTKSVILGQQAPLVALTIGWVVRKRARGLDPRILVATKEYVGSFKAIHLASRLYAVTAQQPLHEWLAEGTKNMPARSVVEPVKRAVQGRAGRMVAAAIAKGLSGG